MRDTVFIEPSEFVAKYYCYADGCGYESDEKFHVHRNYFNNYLIMMVKKGQLTVFQNGNRYLVNENEYIFMDLHQSHEYYFTKERENLMYWTHVNGAAVVYLVEKLKTLTSLPIIKKDSNMLSTVQEIIHLTRSREEMIASVKIYEAILRCYGGLHVEPKLDQKSHEIEAFQSKASSYINTHIHQKIYLDDFSATMNLSKYYFIEKFKKIFLKTPNEYILEEKMKLASYYLVYTDHKLEVVAHMTGFSELSYFLKVFKKKMGMTPNQFRKCQKCKD